MKGSLIEQALNCKDVTSAEMQAAIGDWLNLYYRTREDEEAREDPCQRMAYAVVNKLQKTIFSEYSTGLKGNDEAAQRWLEAADRAKKRAMQNMLSAGDAYIKPVPMGGEIHYSVVRRDCYVVLSRDDQGNDTSVGMLEITEEAGKVYTLVERRTVGPDGRLTIDYKLFRSYTRGELGSPVSLHSLAKYGGLEESHTYQTPMGLGMAKLHSPADNCVDGSTDGVAVYAPAAALIHRIDRNEWQLGREFEHGRSRIIASEDMLARDRRGNRRLEDDVFLAVDDSTKNVGVTIFSPALREHSYLARKNEYLRNIETAIGMKRGILSEVEASERTATEITSSEGDYNLTIIDLQQAWEETLRELLRVSAAVAKEYRLPGGTDRWNPDNLVIDWGDGVLYNRDRTWGEYQQMVAAGMLRPEIALAWYFGEKWNTEKDLEKIAKKYMPEMETLLVEDEETPPQKE